MSVINTNPEHSNNEQEIERLNKDIQEGIIKNIHQQLVDDDINFTGDLSNSFEAGMDGIFHTVESNNKYAGLVEFGMPAGMYVDWYALRIWVEGKLGIQEGDGLTQVTWKIYHKIKGNGIAPKRFFKKSILKFKGEFGKRNAPRGSRGSRSSSSFSKRSTKALKTLKKINRAFKKVIKSVKPITNAYKKGVRAKQ
jgi:hypothetical protein